ncbi:MAG TPA: type II toxin-antitoxin system VapC family toxin [Terriglobales bacterium]|nr:type II toxin-antitoxin system VapC family toxin [Terriglobales bacterium]
MLRRIADLPIIVEPTGTASAFDEIFLLAREQQLTAYDASYLELAVREALPLATLDADPHRAARQMGVNLITA